MARLTTLSDHQKVSQVLVVANLLGLQGGASYAIPDLVANTSNGTALVGMTNFSSRPSYYLERWNPASRDNPQYPKYATAQTEQYCTDRHLKHG